jgi:hypothetical protein
MSRIAIAVLVAALLAPSATAGIPSAPKLQGSGRAHRWSRSDQNAAAFMVTLVRQKLADQNVAAWRTLYPAHQLIASVDAFVACQGSIPSMGTLVSVRAMRVKSEPVRIAGEAAPFSSKAVTVRVAVHIADWPTPVVVVETMHAIAVDGNWRWILSASQYEAYSADACP